MLRLHQVARVYGDQTIFSDVNLELGAGERLALIGANGSGKSTLLRLLAELERPDAGTVSMPASVAYLAQYSKKSAQSVLEAVMPPELRQGQARLTRAIAQLTANPDTLSAFAEAEEAYRLAGGYAFEARAQQVLGGLKLKASASAAQLSGGQWHRLLLARLLLSPAALYLLDEPTNHLDAQGVQWLERWIQASEATFILASHDRAFLDAVATHTAELERGHLTVYAGNYSAAREQKAILREAQERQYQACQRQRTALDEEQRHQASKASAKFNPKRAKDNDKMLAGRKADWGQKLHAARARALASRLERLEAEAVAKPYQDRRLLRLELPPVPLGPAEVLSVRGLTVQRGERLIIKDLDLHVRRGEKLLLMGPNGSGKSTLLRALVGELPYSGEVRWGPGLTLYVAGQQGEELRALATVGEALLDANPQLTPHQLYQVAAQLHLPDPAFSCAALSGGQWTRLSLARLSVTRAQVLILDEPTNHLDLPMIQVLEEVLLNFPGTVLLASHDRHLVEQLGTSASLRRLEIGRM